jgi:hypothetical protein
LHAFSERDTVALMRVLVLVAALGATGCGTVAYVGATVDGSLDADAPEVTTDDASDASEAGDAPGAPRPLTWSQSSADVGNGDVVSIWGSSDSDYYVGCDEHVVYAVHDRATRTTNIPSLVVGAGWSSDPAHVYGAGASGWLAQAGTVSSGGVYQYVDSTWSLLTDGMFYAVWGSSADDVYAAGASGIVHSRGGGTFVSESTVSALGVWGSGSGDVYASTADPVDTFLHSAGDGNWVPVHAQATGRAWAIWSSGPGDVYGVVSPVASGDPDAFVVHSTADGGWADESVGQPGSRLVAVWGSGPHDVYVAGWHAGTAGRIGDLFHSTGDGQWSRVELPGNLYEVTSVWGSGPDSVYVGVFDVDSGPLVLQGQR